MFIVDAGVKTLKKIMFSGILFLMAVILIAGCTQTTSPPEATPAPAAVTSPAVTVGYTDLTPAQAKELIETQKDLVIVDVSPYYANGHLPGAVSIPLSTLDSKISTLDKTKPYLVYCHGDEPSIAGAQKLVDAGFMPVYRLAGNYAAWVSAGYPVST